MPVDWYLNWSALPVVETDCSQIAYAETRFLQLFQDGSLIYMCMMSSRSCCANSKPKCMPNYPSLWSISLYFASQYVCT